MASKNLVERHIEVLESLSKGKKVEAGWFDTDRYQAGMRGNGKPIPQKMVGVPIARIARIQEFGATIERGGRTIVIPARPFMRLAHQLFKKKQKPIQKAIAKQIFNGEITPDQALGQIGLELEGCIVDSIKFGGWERNAESTIRNKGFDRPLIDSSQMWQTVVSKVSDDTKKS